MEGTEQGVIIQTSGEYPILRKRAEVGVYEGLSKCVYVWVVGGMGGEIELK